MLKNKHIQLSFAQIIEQFYFRVRLTATGQIVTSGLQMICCCCITETKTKYFTK